MGLLKSVLGLKEDESILCGILSGRGKAPPNDFEDYSGSTDNSSSVDYLGNCPDCGGMGRTGGNHSYDTFGGSCSTCNGTGNVA